MNFTPKLSYSKCQSCSICKGGSTARWKVLYYNNETKEICDQCYRQEQFNVKERKNMATKAKKKVIKKENTKGAGDSRPRGEDHPFYARTKESGGLLTPKQQEALVLTSLGCTTSQAALLMNCAESTVDNHKSAGMAALGVDKATTLVRRLIEMKITKAEDRLSKAQMKVLGNDWSDGWNRM